MSPGPSHHASSHHASSRPRRYSSHSLLLPLPLLLLFLALLLLLVLLVLVVLVVLAVLVAVVVLVVLVVLAVLVVLCSVLFCRKPGVGVGAVGTARLGDPGLDPGDTLFEARGRRPKNDSW